MWTCLSNENVCYLAHQRETNLWFLFQRKEKKRLATPNNTTRARGGRLQPCYGPLGNLPWLRTCQSMVILPALLYRGPPPVVISKFQGARETFVHSGCFEKFWSSEGGEGRRETWANKESSEDKHTRTLAFQKPCPGLMDRVTLWPQPHQPHTNQNQTLYPMVTDSVATVPYAPAARTRTPGPVHWEGTTHQGQVNEELGGPFHGGFSFLRSEPIRRY